MLTDAQASASGSPTLHSGATCATRSYVDTTQTCGTASFGTIGGAAGAVTFGLTETLAESYGTAGTTTAQIAATTYTGSAFALVPPPSGGTAWGLSGGSQLATLTGNASITYNGSIAMSGTLTLTDATAGTTASGTIVNTRLQMTLVRAATTLATIAVDADGNGTVTYGDGSTSVVAGFTITQ